MLPRYCARHSRHRPQPGRECVDARLLGMVRNVNDVIAISGQGEVMSLDENAASQLAADDDIAKHRDALARRHSINCVYLFPEAEVPRFVGFRNRWID